VLVAALTVLTAGHHRRHRPASGSPRLPARRHTQPPPASRRNVGPVQFSPELRDDVAAGDINVTFRLWRRLQVKVGGRYPVGRAEIEVDTIEVVCFSDISAADVRRAGEHDREALRARAAHAGPIEDDTLLYRIAFHVVG
jgi:hypothetical protein